jgi:hypothetical protein
MSTPRVAGAGTGPTAVDEHVGEVAPDAPAHPAGEAPYPEDGAGDATRAAIPAARRWFVAALLVSFAVRVALALPDGGPILSNDGLGYLANARWIAGVGDPSLVGSHFYSPGYSVVLAALYRLGLEPAGLVSAIQVLNALFATLIALPLGAVVARARPQLGGGAQWVGLVVSCLPALVLQPAFVWPETVLPLLFATWVLLLFRLRDRAVGSAVLLAVLAVAMAATHTRTLGVAAATGVVVVADVVVRRRGGRAVGEALGAVAVLGAGLALERWFSARMVDAIWQGTAPTNAERTGSILDRLRPEAWADVGAGALGQLWYVGASTAGLALLGLVLLARWSVPAGHRPRRSGAGEALPWAGALVAIAALTAAGVLFTAGPRVDHAVYGRYNELWVPAVVALALAWLLTASGRDRLPAVALVPPAIVGIGALLVAVLPAGRMEGGVMPLNILGVIGVERLLSGETGAHLDRISVVPVSLVAAALAVGVGLLAARRSALLVGVAVLFAGTAVLTHVTLLSAFRSEWLGHLTLIVSEIEGDPRSGEETVDYDVASLAPSTRNALQFWLGDDGIRFVPSAGEATAHFVVSQDAEALEPCYERVATQVFGGQELWRSDGSCDGG